MRRRRRLLLVRSLVSSTENEIPRRVSEEVPSLSRRNERIRAESERNNNMGNVHINIGNKESKSSSRGNGTNDTNNGSNCLSRVHTKQYVMSRKRQRPASESQTGTPAKNTSFDTQRGSFISDTGSSILLSSAQTDAAVLVSRSPPEFCEQNVNNISTNPIESCVSSSSSLKEKVLPQSPYRADFRCTHCQGSLHKCPLYSRDLEDEGICDNGISTTNRAEPVILCMSPFCKSPHYHLRCSGVPVKSQIYHHATNSNQVKPLSPGSISKSSTAWWNIPICNSLSSNKGSQLTASDAFFGSFQLFHKDPMSSISSFICPKCDVEGNSRYLLEYFELFHAMKKSFYLSYVDEDNPNRLDRMSECVEARTGNGIMEYLIKLHAIDCQKYDNQLLDRCRASELNISHFTNVLRFVSKYQPIEEEKSVQQSTDNGAENNHPKEKESALVDTTKIAPKRYCIEQYACPDVSPKLETSIGVTFDRIKQSYSSVDSDGRMTNPSHAPIKSSITKYNTQSGGGIRWRTDKNKWQVNVLDGDYSGKSLGSFETYEEALIAFEAYNKGQRKKNDKKANSPISCSETVVLNPTQSFMDKKYNLLDPTYLVGLPIMLFNPVDNSYHSGRIIDCKMNAPAKVDDANICSKSRIGHLLDNDIAKTLYLVRFRDGVDGRNVAIHQWIYLEEHAVRVGGEVCWAKISNGPDISTTGAPKSTRMSPYRPVQIIFRSMLEMLYTSNKSEVGEETETHVVVNSDATPTSVLAMGFGNVFSSIRICLEDADSRTERAVNESKQMDDSMFVTSDIGSDSGFDAAETDDDRPAIFSFGVRDPLWLNEILRRVRLCDEDIGVAVAMASAEQDARVRYMIGST